jgi:hypothetical protein
MGESKHHIVLVVGLTLLPSHLSHCCFTEIKFRKRPDDQTSRNCQTSSQKSRVRDKLVQIMLQILFPCLPIQGNELGQFKEKKAGCHGSRACFQWRSYISPEWQRQLTPHQCSQIYPSHSVPKGLLKTKCLAPLHITTLTALSFLQKTNNKWM